MIRPGSGQIELSLLTFALAVALTVLVAWVLAIAVERPCLRFGRRWSEAILQRESAAATATGEVIVARPAPARWRWYRVPGRVR